MDGKELTDVMGESVRNAKAAFNRIDSERLRKFIQRQPGLHGKVEQSWLRLSEQFPANAKWFSAGSLFIGDAALGV